MCSRGSPAWADRVARAQLGSDSQRSWSGRCEQKLKPSSRHVTRYTVGRIIDAFGEAFYAPDAVAKMRARQGPVHSPTSLAGRWQARRTRRAKNEKLKS